MVCERRGRTSGIGTKQRRKAGRGTGYEAIKEGSG